jgi:FlaA1/EpsC-like NDP-sugar epimerase
MKEELFEASEHRTETDHPMVFRLSSEVKSPPDFFELVDEMVYHARSQENEKSLELMLRTVPNYSAADLTGEIPSEISDGGPR